MKTVIRTVAFIFVLVSMAPALHAQDRMLTLADVSTTLDDLIGGTELDFEFQRDQVFLEVLLDLRDAVGMDEEEEPKGKSLLEKAQAIRQLTKLR